MFRTTFFLAFVVAALLAQVACPSLSCSQGVSDLREWGVFAQTFSQAGDNSNTRNTLRPRRPTALSTTGSSFIDASSGSTLSSGSTAAAQLSRRNNLSVPTLRGRASSSTGDAQASGISVAIDGYVFNGDTPTMLSLDVLLTATVRGSAFSKCSRWRLLFGGVCRCPRPV